MLLFSLVFTTKTIPHSGSPKQHESSQLLSISVTFAESISDTFLKISRNSGFFLNQTIFLHFDGREKEDIVYAHQS
jgi:hypothetical protein